MCCLQSVILSGLADYACLQFIRGPINLKICCYLIASLTISDDRDILFYCLLCHLCACVYDCICATVLIQPLTAKTQQILFLNREPVHAVSQHSMLVMVIMMMLMVFPFLNHLFTNFLFGSMQ